MTSPQAPYRLRPGDDHHTPPPAHSKSESATPPEALTNCRIIKS